MEIIYSAAIIGLIGMSVIGLWLSLRNFERLRKALGPLGYWAGVFPLTRFGLRAAATGVGMLGIASVPPMLMFYSEDARSWIMLVAALATAAGFFHDLVCWLARKD